jgi:inhibitor of cysteine peptidase
MLMSAVTLSKADEGKTIEVHRGDTVNVQVDENPTTGYRWAVDNDGGKILSLQNSDYASVGGGIGGGGQRTFSFKANRAGTSHIQLKHWRDWQGDSSIIDHFDVTVRVKS